MITQPARKIRNFSLTITLLAMVSACASGPVEKSQSTHASHPPLRGERAAPRIGERAAAVALQQVGVPYQYGGSSTRGFDCSGLIQYSYSQAGKAMPRTTGQLWTATATVHPEQLQQGDLLFFKVEGKMSHVGMYLGSGQFVHAPSSGRRVSVESLDAPFYANAFIRGGRPK